MVKKRSDTATTDNFESQLRNLPKLVSSFVTGDVRCLCEMAATLVAGHEYWVLSGRKPILTVPGQAAIDQWYRTIYPSQVCLVLSYQGNHFGYSRNNIAKSLRGHIYHSDQKDRSQKDEAFRRYVFEGDAQSFVEFALSYRWLNSGGVFFDSGNTDSHNPFLEQVKINDRPEEVFTTIESMVLSYVLEFESLSQNGALSDPGRIAMLASKTELTKRFGDELGGRCYETVDWHVKTFRKTNA